MLFPVSKFRQIPGAKLLTAFGVIWEFGVFGRAESSEREERSISHLEKISVGFFLKMRKTPSNFFSR